MAATDPAVLADAIASDGYVIVPGFVEPALVARLRESALQRREAGAFHAAAVGRGAERQVRSEVRGDHVLWLGDGPDEAERELLDRYEALRLAFNQALMLGLFELECHYAVYPPGAGYARHLDRFAGDASRTLSAVLYLNEGWQPSEGGELRLWLDDERVLEVLPTAGTLALFLSERFWHEVRPAARERWSVTGWFRRRA